LQHYLLCSEYSPDVSLGSNKLGEYSIEFLKNNSTLVASALSNTEVLTELHENFTQCLKANLSDSKEGPIHVFNFFETTPMDLSRGSSLVTIHSALHI
jgi:hypothetical protein